MVLHLDRERRSVAFARRWVLRRAVEAGIRGETQAVVELLTSELVANALHHGPHDGRIVVEIDVADGQLRVTVSDEGTGSPVVRTPPPTAEGGRGMMLVDLLARTWGASPLPDGGKVVWFTVPM